jgi:hypothetical protein
MKLIEEVSLWDNGVVLKATVLNAYAVNVSLDKSATFWYGLFSRTPEGNLDKQLSQGNVYMEGDAYANWGSDDIAWNFIASRLNLIVVGDFVEPTPQPTAEEETISE